MKKMDIKKSLLWVSIIPYMYVLLVSIYYTMFDYEGDFTVYGL